MAVFANDGNLLAEFECPHVKVFNCQDQILADKFYECTLSGLPLLRSEDHQRGLCGHPCQEQPPCPRPQHPLYRLEHLHLRVKIKTRLLFLFKGISVTNLNVLNGRKVRLRLCKCPRYDWDFCVSTFGLFSISMWALRRMCQRKLFCIISLKLFILKSLLCDFIKRELQFCYVLVLLKILAMSRVVIIMAFLY